MKKYLFLAIFVLLAIIVAEWQQVRFANEKWETSVANMKAYDARLAKEGEKNIALQLTIDQLGYFKDSVVQELDAARKELGVKEKNLKALQMIRSGFTKRDTVRICQTDTLFKEPSLDIDTLIGDEWYSLKLGLRYPSTIAVNPYFKSVKYVVVSSKKETVNPPKRFFLLRWFQKKHRVLHIDVIERNPYVDDESSEYIEVIK